MRFRPALFDGPAPQMGTAVKFALPGSAITQDHGYALSDAYATATWPVAGDIVVAFAGGPAAQRCLGIEPGLRETRLQERVHEMLGRALPETANTHFIDWTMEPFTRGGYAIPAPSQTTRMRERWMQMHHRLAFAGKHTSLAFFGFMEGTLRSGEKAAWLLLDAVG